ncbi:hypothetical protein HPB50_028752 [Hyalomma asiaticum]|nr:hypothetical protein HPB50_028752 [Hyalomma asiaticum]
MQPLRRRHTGHTASALWQSRIAGENKMGKGVAWAMGQTERSAGNADTSRFCVREIMLHVVPNQFSYRLRAVDFSMCDISARMHCLAGRRSKIDQTVTGKYANAMRVCNSMEAATARPTFFRFISFETSAPNLRQTVPKGDAASVRVVRSTPAKQRRNARVAVASVSTVHD